jgi:biopolymer transport protein ExbD
MATNRVKHFAEINITPLTDIFLVLLIIIMVVAPMLETKGLPLALPTISTTQTTPPPKQDDGMIHLILQADGTLLLDGNPLPLLDAVNTLKQLIQTKPEGVQLQVHSQAAHQQFASVLDAITQAGASPLSVVRLDN